MNIRVRELANGEWIAEVRGWFGWSLIARDCYTHGDVFLPNEGKRITTTKDYTYSMRYRFAAKDSADRAVDWARQYAASRGKSTFGLEVQPLTASSSHKPAQ